MLRGIARKKLSTTVVLGWGTTREQCGVESIFLFVSVLFCSCRLWQGVGLPSVSLEVESETVYLHVLSESRVVALGRDRIKGKRLLRC